MPSSDSDPTDGFWIPGWVSDLRPLRNNVEFLTNLASDPVSTLRGTVKAIISVVVVGGLLDMARELIDALLALVDSVVSLPVLAASLIGDAGGAIGSSILAVGDWYVAVVADLAAAMGPFGIFVQVAAYVGTAVVLIQLLPPALNALSDLLGAIPVVGSILDSVLTFAIGAGQSLSGVVRGD